MRNCFDKQLVQLNDYMLEMGSLIEQSIEMCVKALVSQDEAIAKQTIEADDDIDHQEKKIEDLCLQLLLQQQPVASDMRVISSALKMVTDMERIGDQAADICEVAMEMSELTYMKKLEHIQSMAKETTVMVVKAVEAYVHKDQTLAEEVIARDDTVDRLFNEVKKELITLINQNAENGGQAVDFLMIAKYFERIGDHATNIAEWVIYSITGEHNDYNH